MSTQQTNPSAIEAFASDFVQWLATYGEKLLQELRDPYYPTAPHSTASGVVDKAITIGAITEAIHSGDPVKVEREIIKGWASIAGGFIGSLGGPLGVATGALVLSKMAEAAIDFIRGQGAFEANETLTERLAYNVMAAKYELLGDLNTLTPELAAAVRAAYAEAAQWGSSSRSLSLLGDSEGNKLSGGWSGDLLVGNGGPDTLSGGNGSDILDGGADADLLDGGAGADFMFGGTGDDRYLVDEGADIVVEYAAEGIDRVSATSNFTLSDNIENGTISAEATNGLTLTGNELDNILINSSNYGQTLKGGAGSDNIYGGLFDDNLEGGVDTDVDCLAGGSGIDNYETNTNDVVYDADNRGWVRLAGRLISEGTWYKTADDGAQLYKSRDGAIEFKYYAADEKLLVTSPDGTITVLKYKPVPSALQKLTGNGLGLGISLSDGPDMPAAVRDQLRSAMDSAQAIAVPRRWDPLLLDLNGDGQLSTAAEGTGARFDFDANGFAESAGWVAPADGLVVRDLNGNGTIDSGRELFGDQTQLPNGSFAANGFQAIAALDSNADGKVDSSDAAWAELRVWQDADGDGQTDQGELLSMEDAGVSAINTGYSNTNQTDASGNTLAQTGTFTRTDGTTGNAGSFLFDRDPTNSIAVEYVDVPEALRALPDIQSFGNVYSLHQAMARNADLAQAVLALTQSTDYKALRAQFDALVQSWGGASTVDPASRGANIDARQLAVLEAFYGQGFMGVDGSNPNASAAPLLKDAYAKLVDGLYTQYLGQAQLKPVWNSVSFGWNEETGALEVDFSQAAAAMQSLLGNEPGPAVQMLYEFAKSVKQLGLEASESFAQFTQEFSGSDIGYDRVITGALNGELLVIGTPGTETLTLASKGVLFTLGGGGAASGSSGADVLVGGAGSDVLSGNDGDDLLEGGDGNDTLDGGFGADILRGGAGDDTLGGAAGGTDSGYTYSYNIFNPGAGNTYEGGAGNDTLRGTALSDLYLFNLGDGADTLIEYENAAITGPRVDVLRFGAGIAPSDIAVSRSGGDLLFSHINGTDKVTVKNWFTSPGSTLNQVERVEFADGMSWSNIDLTAQALVVTGTAGNDTLTGVGSFNDTLLGGAGNDVLSGGEGNDLLEGGEGNDTLDGGFGADVLRGGTGDDILGGSAGSPDSGYTSYYGGGVSPGAGNTYEGGSGNDTLRGTALSDLYLFNLGDGADTLIEYENAAITGPRVDVLRFGEGIAPSDIAVSRSGVDLLFSHVNGTDKVTVKNWFTSPGSTLNQVERVEFADGTSWSNIDLTAQALGITGTAGNDTLIGVGSFNDTLLGGAGNDVLSGGEGNDILEGGDGNDTLDGGFGADILRGGVGDDILGGSAGSPDSGYTSYYGGGVSPGAGNTYEGGSGNDTLRGTALSDLYLFSLGDGADTIIEYENAAITGPRADVLRFGEGIATGDITVRRTGPDLVLSHVNGTDKVTVKNWFTSVGSTANQLEQVEFADGTVWSGADLTILGQQVVTIAGLMSGVSGLGTTAPLTEPTADLLIRVQPVAVEGAPDEIAAGDLWARIQPAATDEPPFPLLDRVDLLASAHGDSVDLAQHWAAPGLVQDLVSRPHPVAAASETMLPPKSMGLLSPAFSAPQEFKLIP